MYSRLQDNLERVQATISEAASLAGRRADEVRLIAVTKYVNAEVARALVDLGCHDLGESRPQQLWAKAEALGDQVVHWHMIGHLQRNKAQKTLPLVTMLHSGDSLRLLRAANEHRRPDVPLDVLVEVNISGDASKHGFAPEAVEEVLIGASEMANLRVVGLMGMASLEGGREQARRDFSRLRLLRDHLRPNCPKNVRLDELSMGMSHDFDVAIEEGATMVRVGSTLFEGLGDAS